MRHSKLLSAAEKAVVHALKIKEGENFLLVTDKQKMEIAEALAYWAKKQKAEITTYLMIETLRPIKKETKIFEEIIKIADVTAYLLDSRIEEKPFRGFMVKMGSQYGRICMMPGITKEMMERLVNIDFEEMDKFTRKIIDAMREAEDVVIENPFGTRLEFSVKGRKWENDNGDISQKGKHGNLPAGECYTAPVEETFNGKMVVSLIDNKIGKGIMEFKEGKLIRWSGKGILDIIKNIGDDPSGFIVGEFGIGTNKKAKICPNMLEAEKAFGTIHVAIGDSYGLGKNSSKHHYDSLVEKVTIKAKGRFIAKNGKFLI
ncbi:MAG: aminopeptidase [Acidobacteriota bacterium]